MVAASRQPDASPTTAATILTLRGYLAIHTAKATGGPPARRRLEESHRDADLGPPPQHPCSTARAAHGWRIPGPLWEEGPPPPRPKPAAAAARTAGEGAPGGAGSGRPRAARGERHRSLARGGVSLTASQVSLDTVLLDSRDDGPVMVTSDGVTES